MRSLTLPFTRSETAATLLRFFTTSPLAAISRAKVQSLTMRSRVMTFAPDGAYPLARICYLLP